DRAGRPAGRQPPRRGRRFPAAADQPPQLRRRRLPGRVGPVLVPGRPLQAGHPAPPPRTLMPLHDPGGFPGGYRPGNPPRSWDSVAAMAEHGGAQAVAAARRHGGQTMFTLSGGHVFPLYDGAVHAEPPMRILDVRHEQTAVFAAEATARLTREPGLAVLTAGPGVTNGISAVTTAHFNGSAVVILAGRAPDYRWGAGSLQEIDHPLLLAPVTKRAWTGHRADQVGAAVSEAFSIAATAHRGPVFVDFSLEALFGEAADAGPASPMPPAPAPDPADVDVIAGLLA